MLGNPAQKRSLPRGRTQAAPHALLPWLAPCLESHPAGKPRGDWKSLPQSYFPANVSSSTSPLLTKRGRQRGAVEGWEHPCAQPGPRAASPQQGSTRPLPSPAFPFLTPLKFRDNLLKLGFHFCAGKGNPSPPRVEGGLSRKQCHLEVYVSNSRLRGRVAPHPLF